MSDDTESPEAQQALVKREPLSFEPANADELYRYAQALSRTSLLPVELLGKPDNIFLVMLKGQDLGLRPMQALGAIHVIEGKADVGASLMVALVLQHPSCEYLICESASGSGTNASATYVARRRGWPAEREHRVTWDVARAKEAGLYGRQTRSGKPANWDRMPLTMCKRRAAAEICRDVWPDVVLGMYDHDELREVEPVEVVEPPPGLKERLKARVEADAMPAWAEPEIDPDTGEVVPPPRAAP